MNKIGKFLIAALCGFALFGAFAEGKFTIQRLSAAALEDIVED